MTATTMDGARAESRWFYVAMAGVFVFIAFGGFIPTYWAKLATGTFDGRPILHLHGLVFFSWTLFYFVQTTLVATGRIRDHRAWGLVGIAFATAMGFTVVFAAINSMIVAEAIGMGEQARQFSIVSLSALVLFSTLFTLAIRNTHRPDLHKRFMILAMIPLMQAAAARLFKLIVAPDAVGPPPLFVAVPPGLFVDLLIVAAALYDWRTRGRPHNVYLIGGPVILAQQLSTMVIGPSAPWMAFAAWLQSLAN